MIEKTVGVLPTLQEVLAPLQDCAFIYGSVARSEEHTLSDVDVMVIGNVGLADLTPALRKAETRVGREVNATTYSSREFRNKAAAKDHVLSEVLSGPKQFVKSDHDDRNAHSRSRLARPARFRRALQNRFVGAVFAPHTPGRGAYHVFIRWHRSRSSAGVLTRLTLAALVVMLTPAGAAAQSWLDAYNAGDYRTAAALLRPLVIDLPSEQMFPDASAAEHLAAMYAEGFGVSPDAILACSLFDIAERAATDQGAMQPDLVSHQRQRAKLAQLAARREAQCGGLTESARMEAGRLLGCFTADFPAHHFELAADYTVDVTRGGIRVQYGKETSLDGLPANDCIADVALVRYTRAEGLPPATISRHFIEVFTWSRLNRDGRRALVWTLNEVVGAQVQGRAMETLGDYATTGGPPPALSFAHADVRLQMTTSGEVTWRFSSDTGRRGVAERTPRTRAVPHIVDSGGTGSVQIRVVDHMGVAKSAATVRLAGPSPREGKTTQDGTLTFEGLAPGRYDVLAGDSGYVGHHARPPWTWRQAPRRRST